MFIKRIVTLSGILLILSSMLFADNPLISQRYTADPNAFVFKDRVYVICSSDEDNPSTGYNLVNYTLISSDDMVNWTDHNLVFKVKSNTTWGGQAYAPTAIARNGKVYLYFPNGTSGIGVLSADRAEGPYTDMLGRPIIDPKAPNCSDIEWFFDPCIFVDSTASGSQAYLIVGGGKPYGNNFIIVKVNADMKSYSGTPQRLTTPGSFEGPFMHKYNNKYYLHYPTNGASNIDYIMSDNPMTGWGSQARTVLPNPTLNGKNINLGNNSHESIIEYKGKWYMFYHDRRLSNQTYKRNASVDYLNYNSDGTMKTVIVTSEGPAQIKNLNPYDTIQAETIWKQQGIETEFCNEGGVMVTNIAQGDYTSLKGVDFGTGAKTFEVRAASASSGGTVEVHLDSPSGTLIATCSVAGTGGWQTWKTSSCDVTKTTGVKNIYFVYKGSNEPFRLNWFRFTPIDPVGVHSSPKAVAPSVYQKPSIVNPLYVSRTPGSMTFDLSGKIIERTTTDKPVQLLPSVQMHIVK
jgi:arabinoxylan arabinofuranohydrolase